VATLERTPSPGLFATVLHALRSSDPRVRSVASVFGDLVHSLSEGEADDLPAAIAGVLPLLKSDPDRLRFGAEVLVRFDMYTASARLVELALSMGDEELLLAAASLASNPGAPVSASLHDVVAGNVAANIRLYRDAPVTGATERMLLEQRWPGTRSVDGRLRLAPVVVLDVGLGPSNVLRLALAFVDAGATIRQLDPTKQIADWFGPQTAVVCVAGTRSRLLSMQPGIPERMIVASPPLATDADIARVVKRISQALPSEQPLRLGPSYSATEATIWEPEVYSLGVYETREAAFLTSAPTSTLYKLAREGLLHPRSRGVKVFSFSDLVAVRTWRYLKSQARGKVSSSVIPALARFAGDPEAVRVGAASSGHVFVDRGDGWVDVESGEQLLNLQITDLDDAFRPFALGGRQAPDLLHASQNTLLHPAVLHGVPHLRAHRVSAKALAQLDDRGGNAAIVGAYPELEHVSLSDTVAVGHQLIGAR